jgi:DNA repair protein RecO (recombination protein O)
MPGLYKDEAVILKTIKLGEADRIVTMLTRSNGKVRAVAKGVRKTKSRFGARLEPLTQVNLMIYRGRKDLDTITSADIISSFDAVRTDYRRLTAAAAMVELVEKITPDREGGASSTYDLLLAGLQALAGDRGGALVPAFYVKLLSLAGFHPQLSSCVGCGATVEQGGFSPALGGVVCEECWHEDDHAMRLTARRVALLSRLLASDFGVGQDDEDAIEITKVLRRYAEFHLERPLRSVHLLTN